MQASKRLDAVEWRAETRLLASGGRALAEESRIDRPVLIPVELKHEID